MDDNKIITLKRDFMFTTIFNKEEKYEDLAKELQEREFNKGIEQGTLQTKLDTAKKMLDKHMPLEDISEITELSIDEIKKL